MAYYFISDVHLGSSLVQNPGEREKELVQWLSQIESSVTELFLVGDIFDFWFEYKRVIPKGFSRVLGKISEMTDKGITVHFFTGNHDIWAFDYLEKECGVTLHKTGEIFNLYNKKVFVAHGHGLGNDSTTYRIMNWLFTNKVVQWSFGNLLHPDVSMKFGKWWSESSRRNKPLVHEFRGEDEQMVRFARALSNAEKLDYCIFGHLHSNLKYDLGNGCQVAILGEWINTPAYGVLTEDGNLELKLLSESKT